MTEAIHPAPTEFSAQLLDADPILRHCKTDYIHGSPMRERLNPLRYQIGFGRKRPARFIWNKDAWMQRKWSKFNWWLWKRRYVERKRP